MLNYWIILFIMMVDHQNVLFIKIMTIFMFFCYFFVIVKSFFLICFTIRSIFYIFIPTIYLIIQSTSFSSLINPIKSNFIFIIPYHQLKNNYFIVKNGCISEGKRLKMMADSVKMMADAVKNVRIG